MSSPILWGPSNTANNLQANFSQTGRFSGASVAIPWTSGVSYSVGDLISYGSGIYYCLTANTGGSTFEADLALGYWTKKDVPILQTNYCQVGSDFESNTVQGWQLFNIAGYTAGTVPSVAPTIGSASSMTVAVTSSNPLSGKYSLQVSNTASTNFAAGHGIISQIFTLNNCDKAKVLSFCLNYEATLGATYQNYSGSSSNTWSLYIYDVTNSSWIQPAGVYNFIQNSGIGESNGTWQTGSTQTQFRIALLCINPTTGTSPAVATIKTTFDNFFCGPQSISVGTVMDDWKSYTPTFTGFGTVTNVNFQSRRVGDSLEIRGTWAIGTATAVQAQITLGYLGFNGNVTIDTNKVPSGGILGYCGNGYTPSTTRFAGTILICPGAVNYINFGLQSSTISQMTVANGNTVAGTTVGTVLSLFGSIPIAGWSSNTIQSADTDTKVISLSQSNINTATSYAASTVTDVAWTAPPSIDTNGGWDGTKIYTVSVSGYYNVAVACVWNSVAWAAGTQIDVVLTDNNNNILIDIPFYVGAAVTAKQSLSWSKIVYFNAGQQLKLRAFQANGATANTITILNWSMSRFSGPAVVQATDTVAILYTGTPTGTMAAAYNTVAWPTKVKDTHGAYNPATGIVTVPISGVYAIHAQFVYVCTATAAQSSSIIQATVDNVNGDGSPFLTKHFRNIVPTGASTVTTQMTVVSLPLVAGQQVKMNSWIEQTGTGWVQADRDNYLSIVRTGNL